MTFLRFRKNQIFCYQEHFSIFNFSKNNLYGFDEKYNIEETLSYINSTQCFQTDKEFIECIITSLSSNNYFVIRTFDTYLNKIEDDISIAEIDKESFIKIFHIKEEIGGYIYFDKYSNQPRIQIRNLIIDKIVKLNNKFGFDYIELNGGGLYSLSNKLSLSDAIKINDQSLSVILTTEDFSNIIIILFNIYDNDNSIKLRYFKIDFSFRNIIIDVNICGFLFNGNIGLAFYDSNSKYPGYMIFGSPNVTATNKLILFENNNNEYTFSLKDNIEISNNIFGYKLNKIKITSFIDSDLSGIYLSSFLNNSPIIKNQELEINDKIIFTEKETGGNIGTYILDLIIKIEELDYDEYESLIDAEFHYGNEQKLFYEPKIFDSKIIKIYYIIDKICNNTFHRELNTGEKICYEDNFCHNKNYKYYIEDKNECMTNCPPNYYQHFFQCYKERCPPETNIISSDSKICQSIYDYCIINEKFQAICNITRFDEYKYQFENTNQYLKSCNESLIYTPKEIESFLFHNICFVNCPENTIKNEETELCECKYIKYQDNNSNAICYTEEEVFNGKIYTENGECPENSIYDANNNFCKCLEFHYIDLFTKKIECTLENGNCPIDYPYINISSHQCLIDCSFSSLLDKSAIINNFIGSKEIITENIINIIYDDKYNGENLIIEGNNILYEIFSLKNQIYHNNISFLNLEKCEKILLTNYNIEDLYIIKIDYKDSESIKVDYLIYEPSKKIQLNLSYCQNINITIELPSYFAQEKIEKYLELSEQNYDLLNKNDSFYNDICSPFSSKDKTDMILSDRRKSYYTEDLNFCEKNCKYLGYNREKKRIICECPIKTEIFEEEMVTMKFFKIKDLSSFFNIKTYANFAILKCYKLVISKNGEKNNYGSYLFIILIIIYIVLMGIFYYKYEKKIDQILFSALSPLVNKKNEKIYSNSIKVINILDKKENISISKNKLIKKENKNINDIKIYKHNNELIDSKSNNILKENITSIDIIFNQKLNKNEMKLEIKNYNEKELNSLRYEKAIEVDKRDFWEYYFSLIKRKNLIIFTFYVKNDFNILFIKIALFVFSFSLYFVINTLFFEEETIHKIHESKGKFDFIFHLPHIFYSTIISVIFNKIMKFLALSEDDLIDIRRKKDYKIMYENTSKFYFCIKIKFNIFFIFGLLLMIFFWYYIACFCAVFKNSQIFLISDTFLSFLLSLLYPFGFSLLPAPFRILSLKNKSNDRKWLYKFSKILAFI